MIALWIGLFITFVLGLVNLLWGPAILTRREKVAIVDHHVYAEFLPKGTWLDRPGGESIFLNYPELSIEASCGLVLTSEDKKLRIREAEVMLDKKAFTSLRRYFQLLFRNRLQLYHANTYEEELSPQPISLELEPQKTMWFRRTISINCTDEFGKEYGKMEGGSYLEFVQPLLDELETKYQICWTRYDGKVLCWKFPERWWRNLGKKLWG